MRTYGRLLKNIAAIALLLALLSMLLPFCKFSAGGQEMTLSGLDVVKVGGRAGYTYLTEGRVADTFVLKAPITVGTVKSSLSYVQGVGQMRLLAVCAIAALLPVLLCFLSVGMLFLAEGKKTMLLPTLFTSLVLAELLIVLAVFPALYPFLLSGIYFFTLLHGVAWILILTGWITGGYRPPEKQGNEQIKREKNPKRSGHGWRRKKAHRRRSKKAPCFGVKPGAGSAIYFQKDYRTAYLPCCTICGVSHRGTRAIVHRGYGYSIWWTHAK